jgi:hypothetical protein
MRILLLILLSAFFFGHTQAQSTAFVFQGGLNVATQKWDNSFTRQPLLGYHGALSIESVNNDDDKSSFFMQIGYHIKGSAVRFLFYNQTSGFPLSNYTTERFEFRNLALVLGIKKKYPLGSSETTRYYYFGGIRGDYTLSTNLGESPNAKANPTFYPLPGGVRKLMGGVSFGGGIEFAFSDLVGGELKISVNPDFTLQYRQPAIYNVINPNVSQGSSATITIPERRIRNTTLEIGVGLRLLRKVVYVD